MNRKIEEIVATLRHCASHNCIMCPAYSPPNSKCFETLAAACDRLEELEKELIDERYRHDRYADFCVAQGEELSKLKEQQRWIPVTERLPSDPDTFVLCIASGKVNNIELVGAYQLATYNDEDGWILELFPAWIGVHVTHWMPLPEPPKEEHHESERAQ